MTTLIELADARKLTRHNSQARVNWDMLWAQTATNHDGQRIASNDNTLRQFLALKQIADGRPPRDWTKEFSLIERQVAVATTQPEMNRLADLARRLAQELLESEANYRSYHQWLERLIQQTSSNEILQENLFDVSAAQSQKLAEQIQSCATEASQKTHVEIDTELSELHRKQSSLLSVIQSLEAQLNAVAKGDVADTAEPRSTPIRMASMTAYRQTLPKINSLLKPFISPGYAQPKSRDEFAYEHVKRPMSYSALVDAGAIEDSVQGRETLLRIGGLKSVGQHNDRPLGKFPRMNSTSELDKPDVANRVRDAQRLLKKYAANLIDGGLLAK